MNTRDHLIEASIKTLLLLVVVAATIACAPVGNDGQYGRVVQSDQTTVQANPGFAKTIHAFDRYVMMALHIWLLTAAALRQK